MTTTPTRSLRTALRSSSVRSSAFFFAAFSVCTRKTDSGMALPFTVATEPGPKAELVAVDVPCVHETLATANDSAAKRRTRFFISNVSRKMLSSFGGRQRSQAERVNVGLHEGTQRSIYH